MIICSNQAVTNFKTCMKTQSSKQSWLRLNFSSLCLHLVSSLFSHCCVYFIGLLFWGFFFIQTLNKFVAVENICYGMSFLRLEQNVRMSEMRMGQFKCLPILTQDVINLGFRQSNTWQSHFINRSKPSKELRIFISFFLSVNYFIEGSFLGIFPTVHT